MAAVLPFIPLISGAMGVVSAISGANAQAANERANQQAAQNNAIADRQRADVALQQANVNEDKQRRDARMAAGNQRAGLVQNGMDLSTGTGADLVEQSSLNSELDALNIRYQGQLNAKGYNDSAAMNDAAAANAGSRAKSAKMAGYLSAAGSVLSAGSAYKTGLDTTAYRNAALKAGATTYP